MPVNLKVINAQDFIKTTVTGTLDFAASKQTLLALVSFIKQPGEYDVLVDTRETESLLSITDHYKLGEALAYHPMLHQSKICLLVPTKDFDKAGFFETVAVNRGAQVKVFADFEQAMTWLVVRDKA